MTESKIRAAYRIALSGHLINPSVSVDIDDLAHTLYERRSHHYYRAFLVSHTSSGIDQGKLHFGQKASSKPRVGFIFTGQGAQWSQMGSNLIKTFPQARQLIEDLDQVLQKLPDPPSWSLLAELTQERDPAALRQPEFSKPLVTALQLAILEVVKDWGIHPEAVIGHSSGEIAATVASGLIMPDEAIKIAYYRGQATKTFQPKKPLGMLAVGIDVETAQSLEERLKSDGHFARLLLVDAAYHSDYMAPTGELYEKMILKNTTTSSSESTARMYSSVTGQILTKVPDTLYWKNNMVSPVRFTEAAKELLQDPRAGINFLIEIGPKNAPSGPIAQIRKSLSGAAADSRPGLDSIPGQRRRSLDNVAGQLFVLGGSVNLRKVNRTHETKDPSVIVDLPNYVWNHSQRYWHETQASRDWRFKKFIYHDLLGSKMNGTAWQPPIFQKTLRLGDMPWLRDHMMGNQIIFPGAGYCAMAVEAMYQVAMVTKWEEKEPARYQFRFRDIRFLRALVLEEDEPATYTLFLTPARGGFIRDWYEFRVCSTKQAVYIEHCAGLISVETDFKETPPSNDGLKPLELATPASMIYKAATMAKTESRSTVAMDPPPSTYGQSFYPVHPASIDACFYIGILAISKGDMPLPAEAIALASARFLGIGREDLHRDYGSDLSLYDPRDGSLILEMKGLTTRDIETSEEEGGKHLFTYPAWEADFLRETDKTARHLIDLIAHKNPTLTVLELNLNPKDTSSLWVQEETNPIRAAASRYNFVVSDPKTLVGAQALHSPHAPSAQFGLLDVTKTDAIVAGAKFDLIIVNASVLVDTTTRDRVLTIVSKSVEEGGIVHSTKTSRDSALPTVGFISLASSVNEASSKVLGHIVQSGWNIQKLADLSTITADQIVLVLDELILWVTSGAHFNVTNMNAAAINGFFRTIRAEEGARLVNLDVEHTTGDGTGAAIVSCLDVLRQPVTADQIESKFCHYPSDRKTEILDIHACETIISLGAERLGDMDSIHYHELTAEPLLLEDGYVEIEVHAAV
ncbi:hypothetical protein B0H66DRAFT_608772 [Apodospora peruviana]|uniref:PKS/mFAS DH domain-containing protein n=1 Tax=Apodospora peruviana TaxID=516989 RepID=A0AAE0HTA2_9PEZI|nr:hypothetical protein B0H66DRAFT_608772 [Apodospora peruviana]